MVEQRWKRSPRRTNGWMVTQLSGGDGVFFPES
jgi:hypothetical protein